MIWTIFQIAVSRSIGETMDNVLTPIGHASGVALVDALTGNTLDKIGQVLHYPEDMMYQTLGYVLEQTREVVDKVNQIGLNLLDGLYSEIYDE